MNQVILNENAYLRLHTYILEVNANENRFLDMDVFNRIYSAMQNSEYIDFVLKVSYVSGNSHYYRPVCTKINYITFISRNNGVTKTTELHIFADGTFKCSGTLWIFNDNEESTNFTTMETEDNKYFEVAVDKEYTNEYN